MMKNMTMELCNWNVTIDDADGINVRSSSFHLRNGGFTVGVVFLNGEITIRNKTGEFVLSVYKGIDVGDKTVLSIKSESKPTYRYKNFWFTIDENHKVLNVSTNKPSKKQMVDDDDFISEVIDRADKVIKANDKPTNDKPTNSKPKGKKAKSEKPKVDKVKKVVVPKVDKAPKELPPIKGGKRVVRRSK